MTHASINSPETLVINDYYKMVRESLKMIAGIIAEEEGAVAVDNSLFFGRSGSSYFEDDFLKPLIRKHNDKFAERINAALSDNCFKFVRIDAPESVNEALMRTVADVSVFIERPNGEITEEYINVKATAGNTADNVGSWESLNHVLYGYDSSVAKQRNVLLNKLAVEPVNDSLSDYFLWVFNKNGTTVEELMNTCETHSMLGSSLSAFRVNMSQNYPVQFNCHSAEEIVFEEGTTIEEIKSALVAKILSAGIKFHEKQLEMWSNAYEALDRV